MDDTAGLFAQQIRWFLPGSMPLPAEKRTCVAFDYSIFCAIYKQLFGVRHNFFVHYFPRLYTIHKAETVTGMFLGCSVAQKVYFHRQNCVQIDKIYCFRFIFYLSSY